MTLRTWLRLALGYLAINSIVVGLWAQLAPRSFYDGFPGFGRTWVSVDGPYNEHLVRDVGGLNLALTVVLVSAAIALTRPLIVVAAAATAAYGVPHLIYHAWNADDLGVGDLAASLGGLVLFAVLPIAILLVERADARSSARGLPIGRVEPPVN